MIIYGRAYFTSSYVKSYEKFIKDNKIPHLISQYEKIKHNL